MLLQDEGARSTQINPINRRGSFTRASFTGGVPEVKVEDKIGEMVRKVSSVHLFFCLSPPKAPCSC